ncbi:asparagine synthase (glutamine-hydrolyzing) [Vagococcus xieshaowenii]|uniref:asparagine synthase (glutamine-hydrolyzing) n=1 Tax=Vagococcus xieshaowenii TaxID=2562451 RepID=A0AAJ5EFZ0_9ENTE|nr:asparagine synthase (glutamine-hydrolyzing) [Vagococcus xieshaowenii]QCA29120.1 asparagine synthase (glutamine-hydrolyzing) [Vagococcus xieshaowenii]TFZ40904.1 asparagine synthase (glutamine-hydrolyzing) [Vagococcus xieshaowenii]
MCGIVGFISQQATYDQQAVLTEMKNKIIHRGPNSEGEYIDEQAALGFRRLSIIDLEGGTQPIYNETQTKVITFNGEIYNYQVLREQLIEAGHVFTTSADTEVILHGYEEWGTKIVKKLRGMFAFVIWDKETGELFGARDHFGIKPFYYYHEDNTFIYGSEIKSFLPHPSFKKELNKRALRSYLTFQYPALNDETFFKNVYRLPEGHFFLLYNNELTIKKYWDADFTKKEKKSRQEWIETIDEAVNESIQTHTVSDVEVASFLSSGVDSSYVASVLRPSMTYSIGFDDKTYNEATEARRLTDALGLNNTAAVIDGDMAFKYFPAIQYHLDEPDSNPSCVPLYFLSHLASKKHRVVLSGEGADELFAGYQAYGFLTKSKAIRVATQVLKKLPRNARYSLSNALEKAGNFPGKAHVVTSLGDSSKHFIGQAKIFDESEVSEYLQEEYLDGPSVSDIMAVHFNSAKPIKSEINKMQYVDLHQFMAKDILLKADKMSMAHSLELRVPLLDRKLLEVAEVIPDKYLINQHNSKEVFREAANKHIPTDWGNREKLGFPVPIKQWLREENIYHELKELFTSDVAAEFFNTASIVKLLDDHYTNKADVQRKIWTIYTFLVWYNVYFVNKEMPYTDTSTLDINEY